MTEISSPSQIIFILLFQISFRLLGEPINLSTKICLYALIDVLMVSIVVFEWLMFGVDEKIWIFKVFGEPKK